MVDILDKVKSSQSLSEINFLKACSIFIDENFMTGEAPAEDDLDAILRQVKKEERLSKGTFVTVLDLALFLGFENTKAMFKYTEDFSGLGKKAMFKYTEDFSGLGKKAFEYVLSTIEANHIQNAYKNPKGFPLIISLLEKDHNWKKPDSQLPANMNTIKIDYGANFNLVASQFQEQMKESMLEAVNSVKTLTKADEQKLIAPKSDDEHKKISVEEVRAKLQKELKL